MQSEDMQNRARALIDPGCACESCRKFRALFTHTVAVQAFIIDLIKHYSAPGPSNEKTAEYYQLVSRALALRDEIDLPRLDVVVTENRRFSAGEIASVFDVPLRAMRPTA